MLQRVSQRVSWSAWYRSDAHATNVQSYTIPWGNPREASNRTQALRSSTSLEHSAAEWNHSKAHTLLRTHSCCLVQPDGETNGQAWRTYAALTANPLLIAVFPKNQRLLIRSSQIALRGKKGSSALRSRSLIEAIGRRSAAIPKWRFDGFYVYTNRGSKAFNSSFAPSRLIMREWRYAKDRLQVSLRKCCVRSDRR